MNSRGQAALEYLMTYGWALIVIAIVVGVLVFIVATPTGAVACSSNQPGKLNVVSNNISPTTGQGSVVVTNLTAGTMTSLETYPTGVFAGDANATYTMDGAAIGTTLSVGDHTLAVTSTTTNPAVTNTGSYVFTYNDPAGLQQTATITCQNLDV